MAKKAPKRSAGRKRKKQRATTSHAKARKSFDILAEIRAGPILKRGTTGYKKARALSKERKLVERLSDTSLKKRPRGPGRQPPVGALTAHDLADIFTASLAQPEMADLLRECVSRRRVFWDIERDWCPPLWVPAHAAFILALPRARELVDRVRSNILRYVTQEGRLVRPGMPEHQQALMLMLLRAGSPAELKRYLGRIKAESFLEKLRLFEEAADWTCASLGEFYENELYGIILLAVAGEQEAATLAVNKYEIAVSRSHTRNEPLYANAGPYLWAMAHSMLALDIPYRRHRALIEAGEFGDPPLVEELALPDVGGEAFASLNRQCCQEVARWFRRQPVVEEPARRSKPSREQSAEIEDKRLLGFLSLRNLAEKYALEYDAFRKRVSNFVKKHPHPDVIRSEIKKRRPRDPRYVYRETAIQPVIQAMLDEGS